MSKSRIQTLQNQIRILKEQTIALEEKGRHDDELVEALTARLKSKGFLSDLRNSRVLKVLEMIDLTPRRQIGTDCPKSYFFYENQLLCYLNVVESNFYPHELGVLGYALHDGLISFQNGARQVNVFDARKLNVRQKNAKNT